MGFIFPYYSIYCCLYFCNSFNFSYYSIINSSLMYSSNFLCLSSLVSSFSLIITFLPFIISSPKNNFSLITILPPCFFPYYFCYLCLFTSLFVISNNFDLSFSFFFLSFSSLSLSLPGANADNACYITESDTFFFSSSFSSFI